ncbi:MAG: hypothetical protein IKM64_09690 [Clostridia bacterium]|nr:hypothetical protein [Clostridia bacterium]
MPTFTNQALLSYNGIIYPSNVVTGEITEALSMTKTALSSDYSACGRIAYAISILNSGSTTLSNLVLTDDLGAYSFSGSTLTPLDVDALSVRYYINGALQPQGTVTVSEGPPLTISNISVPGNGNVLIVYEAVPNQFAPLFSGAAINNTAILTASSLQAPVSAEDTVPVLEQPQLSITKFLSPSVVPEDGQLTYTFFIQNTGNADIPATDDLILTDTFNPRLFNITVTADGVVWTEGIQYTYNENTGVFTTLPGALPVEGATYTRDEESGAWAVSPGTVTLTVSGTV